MHPHRWIEMFFSGDLTDFSSTVGAMRAVNGTEEGSESHFDITRNCSKSRIIMNTVLHRVYLTLKQPRCWTEVAFQVT
jgi:hypothetical protein